MRKGEDPAKKGAIYLPKDLIENASGRKKQPLGRLSKRPWEKGLKGGNGERKKSRPIGGESEGPGNQEEEKVEME